MADYEVFQDVRHAGNHPVPAPWGFHHPAFHAVGGGVTPHPNARIQRVQDENKLQELSSTKAHLEMQIVGLQQRLGELNRQIQALTARYSRLDP